MTTAAHDDSDWINGDGATSPAERHRAMLEQDTGCYRREEPQESLAPFARLVDAASTPPASPEAVIENAAGECLAHCHPDAARWMLTALGKACVAREAIEGDAGEIISVLLAADLAGAA